MAATGYTTGDPQKVDISGDTMTGDLVLSDSSPDTDQSAASRGYVTNAAVNVTGDTMTGPLRLVYNNIDSDVGHDLTVVASTGIMHQDGPMVQAGPTSVTIPLGLVTYVQGHHVHPAPVLKTVPYGGVTVTLDDPTDPLTYFMVDGDGNIVQNAGVPTRSQRRQHAILGRVVVLGGSIVNVQNSPILAAQPLATTLDVLNGLGDLRVSGIRVTPNSGTMSFAVQAGEIFNLGANNVANPDDPNVSPFNAVATGAFRYVTRSAVVDVTPRTAIDPTIYDSDGVVTTVPGGAGTTTIQRVHCFPTQNIFIQLGQNTYSSLSAAVDALVLGETGSVPFVTNPDLIGGGVRTAYILVTRTATNLADTAQARVGRATRLGDPGGAP